MLLVLLFCLRHSVFAVPLVETSVGNITGSTDIYNEVSIDSFLGIPFAEPPIGDLRFALPRPRGHLGSEFQADKRSASCVQSLSAMEVFQKMSEDCLYLNIYRQSDTQEGDNKTVLFVIHARAFVEGSGSEVIYDGHPLVSTQDVIVVTINYRLALFGFTDMENISSGNLGIYDQRLAMQWVNENIQSFGGDPNRVTLFGVSAGSRSVNAHIITPLYRDEKPLFRAAIMDSGVMTLQGAVPQWKSWERAAKLAESLKCPTEGQPMLDCLRKIETWTLQKASLELDYDQLSISKPTLDDVFIPRDIAAYIRDHADRFVKIPILIGTAKDEGTMFATEDEVLRKVPHIRTVKKFYSYVTKKGKALNFVLNFEDDGTRELITESYFETTQSRFNDTANFIRDGNYKCPMNAFVKHYSKVNDKVFVYHFERELDAQIPTLDTETFGVYHMSPFMHMAGSVISLSSQNFLVKFLISPSGRVLKYFEDAMNLVGDFAKGEDEPIFRGVKWPNYSKGEGVLALAEEPYVRETLLDENLCKRVFPYFDPES